MSDFISNISKIYNEYRPQFANEFEIQIFDYVNMISSYYESRNIRDYVTLHAKSIEFGEETLNLQRNYATKNFELLSKDAYKRVDEISIEWDESDDWKVKKFHDNWINLFYDRDNDQFKSISSNNNYVPYKNFKVIVPCGKNDNVIFWFNKVFPCNRTGLNLKWSKSPTVVSNKITYKVTSYSIEYPK